MADVFPRSFYPAKYRLMGKTADGMPKSGIMSMHITYPDTEYDHEDIEDWESGVNSTDWRQGVTVLIRTNLAAASSSIAEAKNVIAVDLKQQRIDHASAVHTYDLGTEEATRFIAAKINSRRIKMVGERDKTSYLKARYVRQSMDQKYKIESLTYFSGSSVIAKIKTLGSTGFPTEMIGHYQLRIDGTGGGSKYLNIGTYDLSAIPTLLYRSGNYSYVTFSSTGYTFTGSPSAGDSLSSVGVSLTTDVGATHTVVLAWQKITPHSYWSEANLGPVVQGVGSIGLHKFVAKPMDGGNMGLPATNHHTKNGREAVAFTTGNGYNRFSIEGLNSCNMPSIPPPDYHITSPHIEGITSLHPNTISDIASNQLRIERLEGGVELPVVSTSHKIALENGYEGSFSSATTASIYKDGADPHLTNFSMATIHQTHGIKDSNQEAYARPFRMTGTTNENRVTGLNISNEERVFDDIEVLDGQGNKLVLKGKSPWGTIIRDFTFSNERENPLTGLVEVGPSSPGGNLTPNLKIQLPSQDDIPGGIFVRSGHDRVQAWSDKTWGMGGLSAPNPRKAGVAENSNETSQFDTHDRMLIFHCQRILHDKLEQYHGLNLRAEDGGARSGQTRLFASHRISDHAERGSVLKQTNNGVETGNLIPHHRIRFARYGHSFVSPTLHRGTPMSMRRQLHRSHGSAYSLMFEGETEYKHHGFGSGDNTNSATVFELDTLEAKVSSSYATGSFAGDGIPLSELKGMRLPDVDGSYTSVNHRNCLDYLFAPGQEHTKAEGISQSVEFALASASLSGSKSATRLTVQGGTLTENNRFGTANEFMINGFMLNQYLGMGGRLEPIRKLSADSTGNWFVRGFAEGVIRPRVATELATVPPLFAHDPELLNMNAAPVSLSNTVPSTSFNKPSDADHGLIKDADTFSGAKPDAFLCNWLAEYSHPSLFGTSREHFLMFRYREAGMPRSRDYPAVNGLFLRNASHPTTDAQPLKSSAFERLYIAQWLQNWGFNGLNASGHGNIEGLRGAGAVRMGHSTIREASGTLRLRSENSHGNRFSRGEGIGDGIDPTKEIGVVMGIDKDTDNEDFNKQFFTFQPCVAIDVSRRLPVRSWGFRTGSDALNMLAGDPNEADAGNSQAMLNSGRFDGGIHDSVQDLASPFSISDGIDWGNYGTTLGIERSVPVGFVANDFTVEAMKDERNIRQSNELLSPNEKIGIGNRVGITQNGMLSPHVMASGGWDYELDDTRPTELPISGASLWLKADALDLQDGDAITSWIDSSGNDIEFVQATASAQPTFVKSNANFNNMPVVDCDGNDKLLSAAGYLESLNTAQFTLFAVACSDTDDNSYQGIISSRRAPVGSPSRQGFNLYAKWSGTDQWGFWWGQNTGWGQLYTSSVENRMNVGIPDVVACVMSGGDGAGATAAQTLRVNGCQEATATNAFWRMTAGQTSIANVPSPYFLQGLIAEIILYPRALTTDEIKEVESYLSRKYDKKFTATASPHPALYYDLNTKPLNKGTDPWIDLQQWTGSASYDQTLSPSAKIAQTTDFVTGSQFYHLRGNALHTNMRPITKTLGTYSYPPNGQSQISGSSLTVNEAMPLLTSEISDIRQIQSRAEPRLGLVMEVESERIENKKVQYGVVGTRSVSLHSDLMLGYHFPVLPSHQIKSQLQLEGFTVDGAGTATAEKDFTTKPTWSPDSNASKGAIVLTGDSVRMDHKTHALDAWAVRGSADLPAWGGVYILRKTYISRNGEDTMKSQVDSNTGKAVASHPVRKYVDYIVRPVRPLKLFAFASDLLQDGFVLGPRASLSGTYDKYGSQIFTRDKRYGIFEMNADRDLGEVEPITSAEGSFEISYPDFNEFDVVWHLIPSANMLQFAKSDAHRISNDEIMQPSIEPRYSQSSHVGGGGKISQSETLYDTSKGIMGDHAIHSKDGEISQSQDALRLYPRVKVMTNKGANVYSLDDASVLPKGGGKIFALNHSGVLTYSSIEGDDITISSGTLADLTGATVSDYVGMTWYYTDVSSLTEVGTLFDARSTVRKQVVAPSFIDNAVVVSKIQRHTWPFYNREKNTVEKTTLSFQGLLHYEPSDFVMAQQNSFSLTNGKDRGVIQSKGETQRIKHDGLNINESQFPPHVIDGNRNKWTVASVKNDLDTDYMSFNDLSEKNLKDSGIDISNLRGVQLGNIGMRSTDAAMRLLNDAGGDFAGIRLAKPDQVSVGNKINKNTDSHPILKERNQHSDIFVSRDARGLNTMDVIRNLSQIDNRQIINYRAGQLVYSDKVFDDTGLSLGVENGAEDIIVSRLFDSPNEIVIVGDVISGNEIVFVRIQDSERIRESAANGEEGLVKTLRQQIPGLKTVKEARSIAKALLSRVENGAPMIRIRGLMNATSVSAGDLISVNLPTHGVVGKFAVFEAEHTHSTGKTNLVIAQYEKGIEGILADLRTESVVVSGLNSSSADEKDIKNISMSTSIQIVAVHRLSVRNTNNTGFVIGAKHKNGLGSIGVRDNNKRGVPLGSSKSRKYVVK